MKTIALLFCLSLPALSAFGQRVDSVAVPNAAQYEFLRQELQQYRAFLQQERQAHREFLEDAYHRSLLIISVFLAVLAALGAVLTFFGVRTFRNIRETARLEYQKQVRTLLDTELRTTEEKIAALQRLAQREERWSGARLRFVGPDVELKSFRRHELAYFGGDKPQFELGPLREAEPLDDYDAVVHYFAPDEENEDAMLQDLLRRLQGRDLPVIVYTHGLWITGKQTKAALAAYPFQTMANNIITLLTNTSEAFRLRLTA